ncbi:tRNA pseudouridine(55) synthase TruB [Cnuibacter physcomitrellae]|uniref:tRNA pseudouridine(55) synthase TruB n=1 Tax=Cnuibacter physcomitrellae TaxID=1619308 RepID=UPI002175BAE2|nr:tRNA pseudouridine(55) synthase TruB [Cnuibacter physcomitrellae]MCS5496740.1 tRNA pseudouridine(55) synthase TruB [Cnuibacter physcomitrellae]
MAPPAPQSGILLVDKPQGITSHDVVARARRALGTRKVGHAGTLDPMATGLLVLGVRASTRLLTYVVGLGKEYRATVRLGASTVSDDADGEVVAWADADGTVSDAAIDAAFAGQVGDVQQVPSAVSAIKVDGRRAYARVRAGEDVELAPRSVTIESITRTAEPRRLVVDGHDVIDVDIVVRCSSGTYIRAIARDAGTFLGVGGHLTALRRTAIGPFAVTEAVDGTSLPDEKPELLGAAATAERLFPVVRLDAVGAVALSQGKRIPVEHSDTAGPVAAIAEDGRLIGLVRVDRGIARTLVNFPTDGTEG